MILFMLCACLIPLIQLFAGWMMRYHTPKASNCWIGYRTARSMKNEATWKFANQYCGILWMKVGAVLLLLSGLSCIGYLFLSEQWMDTILLLWILLQTAILLLTIPFVERALKQSNL